MEPSHNVSGNARVQPFGKLTVSLKVKHTPDVTQTLPSQVFIQCLNQFRPPWYSTTDLHNRHLFLTDLKAERSKIGRLSSWWEEPRLARCLLDVCLHGLSSVYACIQTDTSCLFPFFKGSNPIMRAPRKIMTSSKPNYLLKAPLPNTNTFAG